MEKLRRHPLSEVWGDIPEKEFAALVEDVRKHGVRESIIVDNGQMLDGWHRFRAALEARVEAPTKDFEGDDPAAFVISANANRRHLTQQQRAACVVAARSWVEVGHNQHSERGDNDCPPSLTNEELAREEGVSVSIIKQVKQGHRDGHGEALRTGEETITSLRKKEARENPRTPVEKLRAAKEELQADNRLLKDEVKQLESSEKARERLQTRVAKLQDDIDYRKGRAETVRNRDRGAAEAR